MSTSAAAGLWRKAASRSVANMITALIPWPMVITACEALVMCVLISDWKWPSRSEACTDHEVPVKVSKSRRRRLAVAEELNFGRAATRLYLSQPALSRQVRSLERLVGCDLLRRSTHRVELTLAGEALLDRARRLLTDLDDTPADASPAEKGPVDLGPPDEPVTDTPDTGSARG